MEYIQYLYLHCFLSSQYPSGCSGRFTQGPTEENRNYPCDYVVRVCTIEHNFLLFYSPSSSGNSRSFTTNRRHCPSIHLIIHPLLLPDCLSPIVSYCRYYVHHFHLESIVTMDWQVGEDEKGNGSEMRASHHNVNISCACVFIENAEWSCLCSADN